MLNIYRSDTMELHYLTLASENADAPVIIWAHGWGQDHRSFLKLAESLRTLGTHIMLDLPGFGNSPAPKDSWGSGEYGGAMADFIMSAFAGRTVIWVGHSFGCRVGTQLAANYPDILTRMVFIGGAGLKGKRGLVDTIRVKSKIALYKVGKVIAKLMGINPAEYARKAGSADYQNAGKMRGTLVKVVNEDLVYEAQRIQCPVLLIYGENDTETPPNIGKRYNQLIMSSEMVSLAGQDHYSVLLEGRHVVAPLIKTFVGSQVIHHD